MPALHGRPTHCLRRRPGTLCTGGPACGVHLPMPHACPCAPLLLPGAVPDANACIMKKCGVFPVEFVCRGFMTGAAGSGRLCLQAFGSRPAGTWPAPARHIASPARQHTLPVVWSVQSPAHAPLLLAPQAAPTPRYGLTTRTGRESTAATPSLTACARMSGWRRWAPVQPGWRPALPALAPARLPRQPAVLACA